MKQLDSECGGDQENVQSQVESDMNCRVKLQKQLNRIVKSIRADFHVVVSLRCFTPDINMTERKWFKWRLAAIIARTIASICEDNY